MGLEHRNDKTSIMYFKYIRVNVTGSPLNDDDIVEMQKLYGK